MGNVGPGELLAILAIALLVFGPKKLPEIGKGIGNAIREFNKAKAEFMDSINTEVHRDDTGYNSNSYSSAYNSGTSSGDSPSDTAEYPGSAGAAPEPRRALQAASPDALPYGSDFYAVEGESQPSFRTAQPEHSAGTGAAHSNSGCRAAGEPATAGSGEGKA